MRVNNKTQHPLYTVWVSMRRRCLSAYCKDYKNYGGRGIKIDLAWDDFWVFVADLGPRPTPRHSLDRVNNDLGYNKTNCRWATPLEQTRNRRTDKKCLLGHSWNKESIFWSDNGKQKVRRCRICFLKYQKEYSRKRSKPLKKKVL